jgi:hypothetical protein
VQQPFIIKAGNFLPHVHFEIRHLTGEFGQLSFLCFHFRFSFKKTHGVAIEQWATCYPILIAMPKENKQFSSYKYGYENNLFYCGRLSCDFY